MSFMHVHYIHFHKNKSYNFLKSLQNDNAERQSFKLCTRRLAFFLISVIVLKFPHQIISQNHISCSITMTNWQTLEYNVNDEIFK